MVRPGESMREVLDIEMVDPKNFPPKIYRYNHLGELKVYEINPHDMFVICKRERLASGLTRYVYRTGMGREEKLFLGFICVSDAIKAKVEENNLKVELYQEENLSLIEEIEKLTKGGTGEIEQAH